MKNIVKAKEKNRESYKTDYSRYHFSVPEWIRYLSVGSGIGLTVCWLCYHSVFSLPLAVLIAAGYLQVKKKELIRRRKNELLYHFKDFLTALHTAMSSGYSLENGMKYALADVKQLYGEDDTLTRELKAMVTGLGLRKSAAELFADLGARSGLDDIRLFADLIGIAKQQGGNVGKVLRDTKKIICEKIETQQEIDQMLAAKNYERKIMSIMPAAIIVYLRLTFGGFIEQLYGNAAGICIMTGCLAVYAGACYLGKRIMSIAV